MVETGVSLRRCRRCVDVSCSDARSVRGGALLALLRHAVGRPLCCTGTALVSLSCMSKLKVCPWACAMSIDGGPCQVPWRMRGHGVMGMCGAWCGVWGSSIDLGTGGQSMGAKALRCGLGHVRSRCKTHPATLQHYIVTWVQLRIWRRGCSAGMWEVAITILQHTTVNCTVLAITHYAIEYLNSIQYPVAISRWYMTVQRHCSASCPSACAGE
jgi:hypothetical protein